MPIEPRYYIRPLMIRFVYLNNLRVRVTMFFAAIVAAALAIVRASQDGGEGGQSTFLEFYLAAMEMSPLLTLLLLIGLLVYFFDLRCRASAAVVAQTLRKIWRGDRRLDLRRPKIRERFGVDFCFSAITMIINSLLAFAIPSLLSLLSALGRESARNLAPIVGLAVLVLQIWYYQHKWPKIARANRHDPWPDDDLLGYPDSDEADD